MTARPLVLAIALVAAARATAADLPVNVFAVAPADEEQTLLFLGPARPLVVRLRVQVDGKGYRAHWDDTVRGMQKVFDTDGDGVLSRSEVARIDLMRLPRGVPPVRQTRSRTDALDVKDLADKVRLYAPEFSTQVESMPESQGVDLFAALDRDKDGRLAEVEIGSAAALLARLDVDDDETISARELAPYRNPFFGNVGTVVIQPAGVGLNAASSVDLVADATPASRAVAILGRYDARSARVAPAPADADIGTLILKALSSPQPRSYVRDERLDRAEIGLDTASFDRADTDGDGKLDLGEIERNLATRPDVELVVRLGRRDRWRAAVEVVGGPGRGRTGVAVGKLGDDGALIDLGSAVIEFRIGEDSRDQALATQKVVYLKQFTTFDADKDGFISRDEVRQGAILLRLFDVADRNGDGKLAEAELTAYLDFQAEVADLRTVLRLIDQGTSLLDLLDADRDRRIGLRELRALPETIRREDRDGDGQVTPREIARHYRWVVGRGETSGALAVPVPTAARAAVPTFPARPVAPTWFLKMDRNRDGDLSPREFLGPADVFAAYDSDGDGLISPAEARRPPGMAATTGR